MLSTTKDLAIANNVAAHKLLLNCQQFLLSIRRPTTIIFPRQPLRSEQQNADTFQSKAPNTIHGTPMAHSTLRVTHTPIKSSEVPHADDTMQMMVCTYRPLLNPFGSSDLRLRESDVSKSSNNSNNNIPKLMFMAKM